MTIVSRRGVVARAALVAGLAAFSKVASAESYRRIPQRASARFIVDNDFAGDPDGLVALAHQLLTPKTRTVLVTSSPLDPKMADERLRGRGSAAGRDLAAELIRRLGLRAAPMVAAGAEAFGSAAAPSAAARAIVAEARRDDPLPLYVTCGGPLTNIAAALRLDPGIARRLTLVWIGGGAYPAGGWEYNLAADPDAAREVIERSRVPLWQVPQDAYRQMQVSIAELEERMRPTSPFAAWLYERFTSPPAFVDLGGAWPMGDTPTVLLTAVSAESSRHTDRPARRIRPDLAYGAPIPDRMIRVFEMLDVRLAMEDFYALLARHARAAEG